MRSRALLAGLLAAACNFANGRYTDTAGTTTSGEGTTGGETTAGTTLATTTTAAATDPNTSTTTSDPTTTSETADATSTTDVGPCWRNGGCDPEADWVIHYPTQSNDSRVRLARFGGGGIALTGNYSAPISLGQQTLMVPNHEAFYLARLTDDGAFEWIQTFSGDDQNRVFAVDVGPGDRALITGFYHDNIDLGGGPRPGGEYSEFFVAAFTGMGVPDGDLAVAGLGYQYGHAVAAYPGGGVAVGGSYNGTFDLGGLILTDIPFATMPTPYSHYAARLHDDLSVAWAIDGGQVTTDSRIEALDTDSADNVVVAGRYSGSLQLGTHAATTLTDKRDAFVAKISPIGEVLWLTLMNSPSPTGDQGITSVQIDVDDSIVIAGLCSGPMNPFGLPMIECGTSPFVARLDPDGKGIWGRTFTNSAFGSISRAVPTSDGQVAILGHFAGDLELESTVTASGFYDVFLAELADDGSLLWSRVYGANNPMGAIELGHDLLVLGPGDLVVSVQLYDGATFGGASRPYPGELHSVIARVRY